MIPSCTGIVQDSVRLSSPYKIWRTPRSSAAQRTGVFLSTGDLPPVMTNESERLGFDKISSGQDLGYLWWMSREGGNLRLRM